MNEKQGDRIRHAAQRMKIAKGDAACEPKTPEAQAEEEDRHANEVIDRTFGKYPSDEDGLAFQRRIRDEGFFPF